MDALRSSEISDHSLNLGPGYLAIYNNQSCLKWAIVHSFTLVNKICLLSARLYCKLCHLWIFYMNHRISKIEDLIEVQAYSANFFSFFLTKYLLEMGHCHMVLSPIVVLSVIKWIENYLSWSIKCLQVIYLWINQVNFSIMHIMPFADYLFLN